MGFILFTVKCFFGLNLIFTNPFFKKHLEERILNFLTAQVIFFGLHQANWELLVPTIDKLGIYVGAVYRHINNPYIILV